MSISARGIAAGLAIGMVAVSGAAFASGALHVAHPATGDNPITRPVPASAVTTGSPEAQLGNTGVRKGDHLVERSTEATTAHRGDAPDTHERAGAHYEEAAPVAEISGSHGPAHTSHAAEHAGNCEPRTGTDGADLQPDAIALRDPAATDVGPSHDMTRRDSDTSIEASHHQGDHR